MSGRLLQENAPQWRRNVAAAGLERLLELGQVWVNMAVQKRLIGVEEASQYLGLQPSTLYCWAEQSKIPSVKMGARLLFDLQDLDRLIEASKRPARSSNPA